MAEGTGFGPAVGCPTRAFQARTLDHSDTPPSSPCDYTTFNGNLQEFFAFFIENLFIFLYSYFEENIMLGCLIGDLAGSVFEYAQTKRVSSVECDRFIPEGAFFSDDTILTVAVCDAILNSASYESKIKEYIKIFEEYHPDAKEYFDTAFSPALVNWARGGSMGHSRGNGAMMRVSPVGYLFDTEEEVALNAELATIPSHDSEEAKDCAKIVALMILYFRQGKSKDEVFDLLHLPLEPVKLTSFNSLCYDTLPVVLHAIYHGRNFEDCIMLARSFGGDTDTNCAITGSIAEAIYGVPQSLKIWALSKIPKELASTIMEAENRVKDLREYYISSY